MRSWELRGVFVKGYDDDWHEANRMEADVARGGSDGGGEIWRWRDMEVDEDGVDGDGGGWR